MEQGDDHREGRPGPQRLPCGPDVGGRVRHRGVEVDRPGRRRRLGPSPGAGRSRPGAQPGGSALLFAWWDDAAGAVTAALREESAPGVEDADRPWQAPQRLADSLVVRAATGSRVCVQVKTRDEFGHVSCWQPWIEQGSRGGKRNCGTTR